ncbi:MAG: TetR/AcrR family transcriptional regulator [Oscillospiraceae bacterium]|nr:TetR/AcrR family transcriptional regulator [Oscillospiraceae bacterium]
MEERLTNRQIRAMETKQKIVKAANILISAKGFENISIEDIAKEAGVSTGSFYTYFKRKEDVVEELSRTDFFQLAKIVNEMIEKDIIERLRRYCNDFLKGIEKTGIEICRQWTRNNLSPTNILINGEKTTKYKYDYRAMQSVLAEGIKRRELTDDLPIDDLALFFNAQLYGLMIAWCMTDGEVKGSEQTDILCDTIIKPALKPYMR